MANAKLMMWLLLYGKGWVEFQRIVADGVLDNVSFGTFDWWISNRYIERHPNRDEYRLFRWVDPYGKG
jgi:hypothetical protein